MSISHIKEHLFLHTRFVIGIIAHAMAINVWKKNLVDYFLENSSPLRRLLGVQFLFSMLLLNGCAIVQSRVGTEETNKAGVVYMLPKAFLPVSITDKENGKFTLTIGDLKYLGDPDYLFKARYHELMTSDDDVTITVDPKTSLLVSINASADDKMGEIITNIAKVASKLAAGPSLSEAVDGTVVFRADYGPSVKDPKVETDFNTKMTDAVKKYSSLRFAQYCKFVISKDDACTKYYKLARDLLTFSLNVKLMLPTSQEMQKEYKQNNLEAKDLKAEAPCKTGICYRFARPFEVEFLKSEHVDVSGELTQIDNRIATTISLPNDAPLEPLDILRTPFVKRENEIELTNGMLTSVQVKKPSELLAVSKIPLDIITAIVQAPIDAFTAQLKEIQTEKNVALEKIALIEARKELAKAEAGVNLTEGNPQPGTPVIILETSF